MDRTHVSHIEGGLFTIWATRGAQNTVVGSLSLLQGIFPNQKLNRVFSIVVDSLPAESLEVNIIKETEKHWKILRC